MNYLTNLFGGGNAAGGMRRPMIDEGFNPQMMPSNQPSMNLGMTMPSTLYAGADTGTGMMPPLSFGQMPAGFDLKSALASLGSPESLTSMKSLLDEQNKEEKQPELPQMQMPQLPMGSNQNYEELLKMYGVRSGGLLG